VSESLLQPWKKSFPVYPEVAPSGVFHSSEKNRKNLICHHLVFDNFPFPIGFSVLMVGVQIVRCPTQKLCTIKRKGIFEGSHSSPL
jgi:hypothetical protein